MSPQNKHINEGVNFFTGREEFIDISSEKEVLAEGNRIADQHFEIERMLTQPSVVFEFARLALQQPFPYPKYATRVQQALENNRLQLVNVWGAENCSQAHSLMYASLGRVDYNAVPGTIILLPKEINPFKIGEFTDCPLWVKKLMIDSNTGESLAHRGRGVSFFYPKNKTDIIPTDSNEFIQQFVIPPDGYIRDIRVYIVGDKVIPGAVRKAKKPITPEQLERNHPISQDQFVSAQNPGETLPLDRELAEKAITQAREFREAMIKSLKLNNKYLDSQPVLGFGSVDFLMNEKGELVVSDFDVGPSVVNKFGVMRKVAKALADYLISLSQKGEINRDIYIFGDIEDSRFLEKVQTFLLQLGDPKKMIFRKSLEFEALLSSNRTKAVEFDSQNPE